MNENEVLKALKRMRAVSKQRKFSQSVDFTMNFKGLDLKKPQNRVNLDITLPNATGKVGSSKIAVFVKDKNFASQLKEQKATVIMESQLEGMNKKDIEKLASEYDGFLAEGPAMLTVAKYLGQILAPKGKMPKPITTDIKQYQTALSKLSTSVKVSNNSGKFMPVVHLSVGKESNSDDELSKNILTVYNAVLSALPGKIQNIKSAYVKTSMGPAVKISNPESSKNQLLDVKAGAKSEAAAVETGD